MIRGYILRAGALTLALLIIFGLFSVAQGLTGAQSTLRHTANALRQDEPARIVVRDPGGGEVPTVEPEAIERALRQAGIEAVVVREEDSSFEGTDGDGAASEEESRDRDGDRGSGDNQRRDGSQGEDDDRGDGRDGDEGEDPTLLAACADGAVNVDLMELLAAHVCADVDTEESEEP